MSIVVVIPARLGSTRLPSKVLAEIDGVPLVVHVMRRAAQAKRVERVIVATDDDEILRAVQAHGGEARMTGPQHKTGTDRVAEVAQSVSATHFINVQGDNLNLDPLQVDAVAEALIAQEVGVITPVTNFPEDLDVKDPSKVKAVLTKDGRAVYFSRAPVPTGGPFWLHVGIYGFRSDVLQQFASLAQSPLEISEGLEQLRLIEHGIEIHTVSVARATTSIDTPDDLARARSQSSLSSTLRL